MRILDEDMSKSIKNIIIYLTESEAKELRGALSDIINKPRNHVHISDESYQREITICIYDKVDLSDFDERSKELIMNDE